MQEAPAEQGLAALQGWGGGFPGWGRGRGGRRGTVSAELKPYVRTLLHRSGSRTVNFHGAGIAALPAWGSALPRAESGTGIDLLTATNTEGGCILFPLSFS